MGTSTAYPTPRSSMGARWTDQTGTALRRPDGSRVPENFPPATLVSEAYTGGATPWKRLSGPNDFRAKWAPSAEWTNVVKYTTAQSPANGPCMFRREGASILFDFTQETALYGSYKTNTLGLGATELANTTIAVVVYMHRIYNSASTSVILRIGKDGANYITYQWRGDTNVLREGWNVLLCSTTEPIGASAAPVGQLSFQTNSAVTTEWTVAAGTFDPNTNVSTINYAGLQVYTSGPTYGGAGGMQMWVEGIYYGGKDKTLLTLGFDIHTSGLDLAKTVFDEYGLLGYVAVPTANGDSQYPTYHWNATDVARLRALHAAGWDILQHSVSHNPFGTISDEALILAEHEGCRSAIVSIGCAGAEDLYASPNGSYSNRTISLAAQSGIRWARHVVNAPLFQSSGLIGLANPLLQGSASIANESSATRPLQFVDALIRYGCSGHFYTHSIVSGPSDALNTNVDVLRDICAGLRTRIDAGMMEVVPPREYIRRSNGGSSRAFLASPSRLAVKPDASPWSMVNTSYRPIRVLISGGTVSSITYSRNGSTLDGTGQTGGVFDVNPGDKLVITYSGVPTVIQVGL